MNRKRNRERSTSPTMYSNKRKIVLNETNIKIQCMSNRIITLENELMAINKKLSDLYTYFEITTTPQHNHMNSYVS